MKEHQKLCQKKESKVMLHFVLGQPSRKQTAEQPQKNDPENDFFHVYHFVCVHSCLLNNVLTLIFSNSAGKLDQSQVQQRDVLPGHIIGEDLPADGVRASSLIHGYSRRTPAVAGVITTNYLLGGHSVRKSIDFSHSEAESRKVRT